MRREKYRKGDNLLYCYQKEQIFPGFGRCLSLILSWNTLFSSSKNTSSLEITHISPHAYQCIFSRFFFMVHSSSHKNITIHPSIQYIFPMAFLDQALRNSMLAFCCVLPTYFFIRYTHVSSVTTNSGSAGITEIQRLLFFLLQEQRANNLVFQIEQMI